MCLERNCLEQHHLQSFIRPTPCRYLASPGFEHRQRRGGISLGEVDTGLADGEFVRLRKICRRRQLAMAQQRANLCGSNVRHPKHEVVLAEERFGLVQNRERAGHISPGKPQASFDKQFVRDWLEAQPWDKTGPGPELPEDVIAGTRARYIEAYERITGASFERYLQEDVIAS